MYDDDALIASLAKVTAEESAPPAYADDADPAPPEGGWTDERQADLERRLAAWKAAGSPSSVSRAPAPLDPDLPF